MAKKKHRITFEIEPAILFDSIHLLGGDTVAIGRRLIGVMMTGDVSLSEAIGMGVYGISVVGIESMPAAAFHKGKEISS